VYYSQATENVGFRRLTVLLPPNVYERLIRESARRKIAKEPNRQISAILREAVRSYFGRSHGNSRC
jgi:hypothetical protein